jgi:hypothetical protein
MFVFSDFQQDPRTSRRCKPSYCPTATPRMPPCGFRLHPAPPPYRNRRIRFRRERNQLTAYSAIVGAGTPNTSRPRIANTDCIRLSRGSLDGVNPGRSLSNSRTRVLTCGQIQNLETAAASSLLNETPAWEGVAGVSIVAVLRRPGRRLRPSAQPRDR